MDVGIPLSKIEADTSPAWILITLVAARARPWSRSNGTRPNCRVFVHRLLRRNSRVVDRCLYVPVQSLLWSPGFTDCAKSKSTHAKRSERGLQSAGPTGSRKTLGIFNHAPSSRTVLRDKSRAPGLICGTRTHSRNNGSGANPDARATCSIASTPSPGFVKISVLPTVQKRCHRTRTHS